MAQTKPKKEQIENLVDVLPTADEKAALVGTGTPSASNRYVTEDSMSKTTLIAMSAAANAITPTVNGTETIQATVTIPGGTMGPNGRLRISALWKKVSLQTTQANFRIRFGGISGVEYFFSATSAYTNAVVNADIYISNRNSESSQVGTPKDQAQNILGGSWLPATSTLDTTAEQTIVFTALTSDVANVSSYLESYMVELIKP